MATHDGASVWYELTTPDAEAARAFHTAVAGWHIADAHDLGPMGIDQTVSAGGAWTGGMTTSASASGPHWHFYVAVDDIDAAVGPATAPDPTEWCIARHLPLTA